MVKMYTFVAYKALYEWIKEERGLLHTLKHVQQQTVNIFRPVVMRTLVSSEHRETLPRILFTNLVIAKF